MHLQGFLVLTTHSYGSVSCTVVGGKESPAFFFSLYISNTYSQRSYTYLFHRRIASHQLCSGSFWENVETDPPSSLQISQFTSHNTSTGSTCIFWIFMSGCTATNRKTEGNLARSCTGNSSRITWATSFFASVKGGMLWKFCKPGKDLASSMKRVQRLILSIVQAIK